jgi:hypothetical protein
MWYYVGMKKLFFILIPAGLLTLLAVLSFNYFVKSQSQKGALQVTSVPESKVYLNDKYLGQTPLCKCEAANMLPIGDYTIRLVPADKDLSEFQEKVTISEAVLTVVDRKFGKESLSEGSVISLMPLADKKKTELVVVSFPQDANVLLDNNPIGKTPLDFKDPTESDHEIKVSKDGYNEKTIRIRTPAGFKLTVAAYLSTNAQNTPAQPAQPVQNSVSASPAPSAVPSVAPSKVPNEQVLILDTPTGFLRVRQSASVNAAELARVQPGEKLDVVQESNGWYLVRLSDGIQGWISSEYAQKQ